MTEILGRLYNKVAIITGGSSGIGESSARLFAEEGAKVVIVDINKEKGEIVAKEIKDRGKEALFIKADISKEDEVKFMVEETVNSFKKIDILFNNAGIAKLSPVHELDEKEWDRVININLKGAYLCSKHVIPYMKKQKEGSIINTASIAGVVGFPGAAAYCASKGGLRLLTRNMALDYAPDSIRVNDICPAVIETPMTLDKEALGEEAMSRMAGLHPLGRIGKPEEVAVLAVFLASSESSFITGSSFMVDGGYTAK
ncbi:MAG: short-chain dehydrogenase [Firmicutes bacterium HGW-Firmicutes-13]|nr:MAG: short-chain dehydrogenase [Firmicutes bacterium HGW-Firmicutes-13]